MSSKFEAYQEWSLGHLYNKSLLTFWISLVQLQETKAYTSSETIQMKWKAKELILEEEKQIEIPMNLYKLSSSHIF